MSISLLMIYPLPQNVFMRILSVFSSTINLLLILETNVDSCAKFDFVGPAFHTSLHTFSLEIISFPLDNKQSNNFRSLFGSD